MRWRTGAASVILSVLVGMGRAQVTTWIGSSGDWDDSTKWDNGLPDANKRAVIDPSTGFLTVRIDDDEVVDTIVLGASAILLIFGPGSLTLENDNHNAHTCPPLSPNCTIRDHSIVNGILELRDESGTTGDLIFTTESHIFDGEGRIEDIKNGGRIEIDPDIRFTNSLTDQSGFAGIHGSVYIFGRGGGTIDGEFYNDGRVQAAGSQPLTVDAVTSDASGAEWNVECDQIMIFKREALDLEGDFSDDPPLSSGPSGEFVFEASIWTCGTFTRNGCCGLTFENSSFFSYAEFVNDSTESCANPGTSEVTPTDCDDPWTVSTDVLATNNSCGAGGG